MPEALGLFEDEVRMIELAAPLHDIGKIAIPDALLLKPGPLTPEEMVVMRRVADGSLAVVGSLPAR